MARQDFADGGFIGKLGQVIGQRWHNKRYVRAYFKPPNPRSEKQIAVRKRFAQAIELSQLAFRVVGHNNEWDTTDKTQFNAMMSQCLNDLKNGIDPVDAVPYHPHGWTPGEPAQITSVSFSDPYNCDITLSLDRIGTVAHCWVTYERAEVQMVQVFTEDEEFDTSSLITRYHISGAVDSEFPLLQSAFVIAGNTEIAGETIEFLTDEWYGDTLWLGKPTEIIAMAAREDTTADTVQYTFDPYGTTASPRIPIYIESWRWIHGTYVTKHQIDQFTLLPGVSNAVTLSYPDTNWDEDMLVMAYQYADVPAYPKAVISSYKVISQYG